MAVKNLKTTMLEILHFTQDDKKKAFETVKRNYYNCILFDREYINKF